jgi:hypothetical protein
MLVDGTQALTDVIDWSGGNVTFVPLGGDIQTYVTNATAGDTLVLASGVYTITSTITIAKELNIVGQGRSGFVTAPVTASHGTLIGSATAAVTAFAITSDNVRIANLSINLTGAGSTGISTATDLQGIVFNDRDVIVNSTGANTGFSIMASDAVMRDVTFYITSSDSTAAGVYFFNDNTAGINATLDAFNVTGTVVGGATYAYALAAYNNNSAQTLTLNLSNSIAVALAGTALDIAVISTSTTTNNSTVNCYMCNLNGADYDAYQSGTNVLNLGGSILENALVFGTVTYRAVMTADKVYADDIVSGTYNFAADAEASDTYAITLNPAPTAYTTGMIVTFTANTANTGACTLNVNALGAKSLKVNHDQDPPDNYIESGSVVVAVYDGTNFQVVQGSAQNLSVSDYAGIYIIGNAVATTILLVDAYEPITVYDTDMPETISNGDNTNNNITIGATAAYEVYLTIAASGAAASKEYEADAFEIAASGDTITGATQATPCVITAVGHSFNNADRVKISGVAGMTELNGHIYTVTNKAADTFELEDDNGADINSGGYGAYTAGGTAFLATLCEVAHVRRTFGGIGIIGTMSSSGIANLTAGNTLEVHVKNISDANNLTVESSQFWIKRV